ncbi:hypothetical protein [Nocardia cyriacigeorgica]|nr:hypothetical protein [Nocardia cyriacigeorgica]
MGPPPLLRRRADTPRVTPTRDVVQNPAREGGRTAALAAEELLRAFDEG